MREERGSSWAGFDQGLARRARERMKRERRTAKATSTMKSGERFLRRRQRRTARFGRGMRMRRAGAPGTGTRKTDHAGRIRFSVAGLSSPLFIAELGCTATPYVHNIFNI